MKFYNLFLKIAISIVLAIAVMSCSDDPTEPTPTEVEVKEVALSRKTGYGNDWIYYSLEQGKEIEGITEDDHKTNMNWDIAFNRNNIRTNSGLSGNGEGGAFDTFILVFDSVAIAPTTGYTVDTEWEITQRADTMPPIMMMSTASPLLSNKAIVMVGMPPIWTPNNHIYIIKTATGKYAKVWFTSFFNAESKSGFVSFQYAYQPDGSTKLK